jgi:uroporphyrinogen-III synthase
VRIIVTRPAEDAAPIAALLEAAGHKVLLAPLLAVEFLPPPPLPSPGTGDWPWHKSPDAIVATSRHAVTALAAHPLARSLQPLTLYAVAGPTA